MSVTSSDEDVSVEVVTERPPAEVLPEGTGDYPTFSTITSSYADVYGDDLLGPSEDDVLPEGSGGYPTFPRISSAYADVHEDVETVRPSEDVIGSPVTASVCALHYINGENENFTQGGHPLHSSQMQLFKQDDSVTLPVWVYGQKITMGLRVGPVIDNWQKGDMIEHQPMNLDEALVQEPFKNEDEFLDDAFNTYRFMNQIKVSFDTTYEPGFPGPLIDHDTLEITFNERANVEDESVSFMGLDESYTVLVNPDEGDVDDPDDADINNLLGHGWFDDYDELRERGTRKPRYYTYDTVRIDETEALRVTTISGSYAGFSQQIAERGRDPPDFFGTIWGWGISRYVAKAVWLAMPVPVRTVLEGMAVVPNIYSFLEFFVLTDGRQFVRVWDASPFPGMDLFINGTREWLRPVGYEPRQRENPQMRRFFEQAVSGETPYHAPSPIQYLDLLSTREAVPLKTIGLMPDGEPIEEPATFLPDEIPDPLEERVPSESP